MSESVDTSQSQSRDQGQNRRYGIEYFRNKSLGLDSLVERLLGEFEHVLYLHNQVREAEVAVVSFRQIMKEVDSKNPLIEDIHMRIKACICDIISMTISH